MEQKNKTLYIAIAVFMVLAVFGAVVFGGSLTGKQEQVPEGETIGDSSMPVVGDGGMQTAQGTPEPDEESAAPVEIDVEKAMAVRAIGNPSAPIRITEYASLSCHHCADFNQKILPTLKEKYIESGQVYFVFEEFPLNAPALDGALLARCLPAERYESFTGLLFKTQEDWSTRPDYLTVLKQNAKLAGLSDQAAEACLTNIELRQAVGKRLQEASAKWQINATPTFVINDGEEVLRGTVPLEEFERIITGDAKSGDDSSSAAEPQPEPATGNDAPAPSGMTGDESGQSGGDVTGGADGPVISDETPPVVPAEDGPTP